MGSNPTLGPIGSARFYAVRLCRRHRRGDGLVTDTDTRVPRADGTPVDGLYTCGACYQAAMATHFRHPIAEGPLPQVA